MAGSTRKITYRLSLPCHDHERSRLGSQSFASGSALTLLQGERHRLLSFQLDEADDKGAEGIPEPSDRFAATVFDYAQNHTLIVGGRLNELDRATVTQSGLAQQASDAEFEAAAELVLGNAAIRRAVADGERLTDALLASAEAAAGSMPAAEAAEITIYRPLPPLVAAELADGGLHRVIPVGLYTPGRTIVHRIVGVDLNTERLVLDLPDVTVYEGNDCGAPVGNQQCPSTGTGGQVHVRVTQGGRTIWRLIVVRPAATGAPSSTNGTGVELRYVDYRGKRVLYRGHVPILNVRYPDGGCAPSYRDWETSEACFQAVGNDVIPGYRLCPAPATTILDTGVDGGNFRGVALYLQGSALVLVSVLQAGWYRYESQWRLHVDGTISPRFGFAATSSSCTCFNHHHHAYWRLDFDIETPGNNVVQEYNDPPIIGGSHRHTKRFEIRRQRDAAHKRHWEVSNAASGAGYSLLPGPNDGFADSFGVGDVWVLRYHGNEIDDGQGFTTNPALAMEHIDKFLNGESVYRQDVVLWYVGHFMHNVAHHAGSHRVGPELRPFNWDEDED
jgi:Copper amine oxidase, enzyme domain